MFHAVDDFFFLGRLSRAGDETSTGGHVNEDDRIVFRVDILFHGKIEIPARYRRVGRGDRGGNKEGVKSSSLLKKSFFCC